MPQRQHHPASPQVVRADEVYTVAEFRRRMGIGDFSWREIRRKMPVIAIGRKRYVRGVDWIEYLRKVVEDE